MRSGMAPAVVAIFVALMTSGAAFSKSDPGGMRDQGSRPSSPVATLAAASRTTPAFTPPAAIAFEPARDTDVWFSRGRGFHLYADSRGARFVARSGDVVSMRLPTAGRPPAPEVRLAGVSNYLLGDDPALWRTRIPRFRSVRVDGIAPGVDLRWRGDRGAVEYEIACAPGATQRSVPFRVDGADTLSVRGDGALAMATPGGTFVHSPPLALQPGPAGPRTVPCRFVGEAGGFRIEAGPCDPTLPLVIDPRVEFSGCFGGTKDDVPAHVAVDAEDNIYLAGTTWSTNWPTKNAIQGSHAGINLDTFVAKFDATATTLEYSTYLGGIGEDTGYGVAVDGDGSAYVVGEATQQFPTKSPIMGWTAFSDGFLLKLTPSGDGLVYGTYLGGNQPDRAAAVFVDGSGAAYVTGRTASTNFPAISAVQGSLAGIGDAFLLKVNAAGSAIVWSTYLGGTADDWGAAVTVDDDGCAFLTGVSNSSNFPTKSPFQATNAGAPDAFIARVTADGSALVWSSYLGGSEGDGARSIALDADGAPVVGGVAGSSGLATSSAFQTTHKGGVGGDGFVARIKADGSGLEFLTYLGGSGGDAVNDLAVGPGGVIYAAGETASSDFPVAAPVDGSLAGSSDAFLARIAGDGASLKSSTYVGGDGADRGTSLARAPQSGMLVLVGETKSTDFPKQQSYQGSPAGGSDAFLFAMSSNPYPPPSGLAATLAPALAIDLSWSDNSADETAIEIQRKVGSGAWQPLVDLPADTEAHTDAGLSEGVRYTYRLRATNEEGASAWTVEASVLIPPVNPSIPLAPSALLATVVSPTRVDLAWADESDNETFFQVQRRRGDANWDVLATPSPNATAYSDLTPLPDRAYEYRVRANGVAGFSSYSNSVTASLAASLELAVTKGLVKDSPKPGKDAVSLKGVVGPAGGTDPLPDPELAGFEVRLGGRDGPRILLVAPNAEGWKTKKGRATWKSPRGTATKAVISFEASTGAWSLSLKNATVDEAADPKMAVAVESGKSAGTATVTWRVSGKKTIAYRTP